MATNSYSGGFYNPYNTYGGQQYGYGLGQFAQTPLGGQYLEDNQDAAFTRFLANMGYDPSTNLGDYARQQFGKIGDAFKAAQATNPFLKFTDYLDQNGDQTIRNQFQSLTYQQRGENPGQFGIRARTIPR
jgi:hypothetical protein